ncbi:MAG: hypothetical protein DBX55_06425 [Verrucomicrobia bacterium]|nr:MAG: hypothetical protein DBX55_06425 [Verrucomicrobiota bacterium]
MFFSQKKPIYTLCAKSSTEGEASRFASGPRESRSDFFRLFASVLFNAFFPEKRLGRFERFCGRGV